MKILFVGNSRMLHVQRIVKYFYDKGHDVCLFTFERSFDSNDYGYKLLQPRIPILNIGFPFVKKWITAILLKYYIRKFKPDVIHAIDLKLYGNTAALTRDRPLLITLLGSDVLKHSQVTLNKFFSIHAIRFADFIHAFSEDIKKHVIKLHGNPKRIMVNYVGIKLSKYLEPIKDKTALKTELGLDPNSPIILSMRAFKPIYGHVYQILALQRLKKDYPNLQFVYTGVGPTQKVIKEHLKKMNLEKNVKFLGFISEKLLVKYLQAADIYISTSLSDGCPASTLEAMYNELPVIAFDVGGVSEWIEDEKSGFLVPSKDVGKLTEKIRKLIENAQKRHALGNNARKLVEKGGNFDKNLEKIERVYRILKKHATKF
ncbi:MAG: glycosyltransferase family 4 protein [Candidatus Helarchaeota archaeon]